MLAKPSDTPTPPPGYEPLKLTRAQAEAQLKQIAHLTGLLGCAVAARDQDLLNVQKRHQALIESISLDIAHRQKLIEEWAWECREDEFGESKTLEMPDGTLFFRLGNRSLDVLSNWTWEKSLEKLLKFKITSQWAEYIRREPEIDKRKLLQDTNGEQPRLAPSMLKKIGLKIVREERFSLEVRPSPGCFDVPH